MKIVYVLFEHPTVYLHFIFVDLKSINMLLKWPKYCARRMKKILYIILKTNEYFITKIGQYMSKSHMY